ncbi:MAG TPA: VOC family protein [Rhizomicrobium sp.]|jgi:PhnB protein|nr:VOC family protein [Rhizomicrobium sp.]
MPIATSLAPFLSVRRGRQAVAFYVSAFGAREQFHIENPAGEVVARLAIGGAEFWLSDESPQHGNFSPETLKGGTARMVLTVDDPAALFARAVAAGATPVHPVSEQHGFLMGRLADPFGHHWEIVKPLEGQG